MSNNSKYNILVVDGECKLAYSFLRGFDQNRSIAVNIISNNPSSAIQHSKYVNSFIARDHAYDDNYLQFVHDHCKKNAIDMVFGLFDQGINWLVESKEKNSVPFKTAILPPADMYRAAKDKSSLAVVLEQNDIPIPHTIQVTSANMNKIRQLQLPVLIKPVNSSGGVGIKLLNTREELDTAIAEALGSVDTHIIQEYIDGYDIDCNVLAENGELKAYSIQKGCLQGKNKYAPYSGVEFVSDDRVHDVVVRMTKALNWSGVGHIDLRYDRIRDRVVVIEKNCRYWDSLSASRLVADVNFPMMHLQLSKGEPITFNGFKSGFFVNSKAFIKEHLKRFMPWKDRLKVSLSKSNFKYLVTDSKYAIMNMLGNLKRRPQPLV